VYGTYRFKSFEIAQFLGISILWISCLLGDLLVFMTAEKRQETEKLLTEMGVTELTRPGVDSMFKKNDRKSSRKR